MIHRSPVFNPRPKVFFLTRRYPPSVGGMETLAHAVYLALEEHCETELVSLGRSQRHLPWFLPYAAFRARRAARNQRADRLVFGDALAYAVVRPALPRSSPPSTVMVHGLDLIYPLRPYRAVVRAALRHADRVVANSNSTAAIARQMGVDPARCFVLNPGLAIPARRHGSHREAATRLRERYGIPTDARVLATVGRLVRRKGLLWFVSEVMPALPDTTFLLVAGSGPDEAAVRDATQARGLENRVRLLGSVDDDVRALLFEGCDVFVMPNVPVPGDTEGFGLVAIEASNSGGLVVASRLEGIVDAVTDGTTGYLCEPLDSEGWRTRLTSLFDDPDATRATAARFATESRTRSSLERMTRDVPAALGIFAADAASDSPASGAAAQEEELS
jgi:phosphatidylinositol alpha-1,6-mannosyltransferase